jgi:succinate-semialdehyde dehydrogenase/glutarate-semialdehyde dehydrogenase
MAQIYSTNPVTRQTIATYHTISDQQLQHSLQSSTKAYLKWKQTTYEYRAIVLKNAAKILRDNQSKYALLMVQEMGKPIGQAKNEIEKCAKVCEYYANNGADFLANQTIDTEFQKSYVAFQPLGAIFAIMPWNFPFWQVFRCAAPALMSGNIVLLKHASNVLGCGEMIAQIWKEAGLLEGGFQHLIVEKEQIEQIIAHNTVQGVALTGSEQAGQAVGQTTGKYMKRLVLELGGSDPFIVLEDADLEAAAEAAVISRIHNSGQTCISAKRFLVPQSIANEFKTILKEKIATLKIGNPLEEKTHISAMAREDLAIELQEQVNQSIKMGALSEIAGGHQEGTNYFHPMLLSNIQKNMPAYNEEFFGPVFLFFAVEDETEAIRIANDSVYGLGATVWSSNIEKAQEVALQLETGAVTINGVMSSDPRIPFGGIKKSGIGRELGQIGIYAFVNKKSIVAKSMFKN